MTECVDGICGGSPPGVAAHPRDGRDWLVGTDFYVDDVIAALENDGSHARVARRLGLTIHQVRVAEAAAGV
jgi:signal transduction histidine kinase